MSTPRTPVRHSKGRKERARPDRVGSPTARTAPASPACEVALRTAPAVARRDPPKARHCSRFTENSLALFRMLRQSSCLSDSSCQLGRRRVHLAMSDAQPSGNGLAWGEPSWCAQASRHRRHLPRQAASPARSGRPQSRPLACCPFSFLPVTRPFSIIVPLSYISAWCPPPFTTSCPPILRSRTS